MKGQTEAVDSGAGGIETMNFTAYASENDNMTADPTAMESEADFDSMIIDSSVEREICNSKSGEMGDLYDGRELIVHELGGNLEQPYVGMEFESEEASMLYYDAYAKHVGFIIRVGGSHRSGHNGSVTSRRFLCNKEGFRVNKKTKRLEVRKPREVTREGCKAMIMVRKEKSGKWVVRKLETTHSHPLGIPAGKGLRGTTQARSQNEKDKKIRELSAKLHRVNRQFAECREQLETVLKDVQWHTNHLTKSVQDIIENVKEIEAEDEEKL